MRYEAVVIIEPDSGYFFAADGQMTDVLVVDPREPGSVTSAEWYARQLDQVADLPPSSNVRVLVEQFVEDIKWSFGVSQADIDAERQ
jgi:hypothetical protein